MDIAQTIRSNCAPVEVVMPETATGSQYAYVVAPDAAHPNTSNLLALWLTRLEAVDDELHGAYRNLACTENSSENFVPITAVSKEEIAGRRRAKLPMLDEILCNPRFAATGCQPAPDRDP
jgi:hypothetical protein